MQLPQDAFSDHELEKSVTSAIHWWYSFEELGFHPPGPFLFHHPFAILQNGIEVGALFGPSRPNIILHRTGGWHMNGGQCHMRGDQDLQLSLLQIVFVTTCSTARPGIRSS